MGMRRSATYCFFLPPTTIGMKPIEALGKRLSSTKNFMDLLLNKSTFFFFNDWWTTRFIGKKFILDPLAY